MMTDITIVDRNPDDLIFAEYNPRQMTTEQVRALTDSIKRFWLAFAIGILVLLGFLMSS
jgi:hypothetical protein